MQPEAKRKILLALYKEIGSNLRATDEKRDHLFEIYLAIFLAASSGLIVLKASANFHIEDIIGMSMLLLAVLFVFGETVLFSMVGSRKWHAEYVNCLILDQTLLTQDEARIAPDFVPEHKRHGFVGNVSTSNVFILVQITIAAILIMAAYLANVSIDCQYIYPVAGLIGGITIFCNYFFSIKILKMAEDRFWTNPGSSWCFSGLML